MADEIPEAGTPRAAIGAALALLGVALAFAYAPTLGAEFLAYDDDKYVTANPVVQAGLSREGVAWAFSEIHDANWIPLVWISLMIDHDLHGLDPGGYHATNVLIHALSTLLLFLALVRLTRAPWRSLFVAGIFALHPLHVQSVAWVAERKDVLSGFFWMAALLAYSFYVERTSLARYVAVAGAMAAGLLCKATLVTLPFALLLLDAWPAGRIPLGGSRAAVRLGRLAAEKIPLLLLSAAASAVTLFAQGQGGAIQDGRIPLGDRLANALVSYGGYLRKTVWPNDLSFFYTYVRPEPASPEVWLAGLLLVGATAALAAWSWRSAEGRPACVGWLWFVGTLVPMIGIVQVGGQAMADRYMYVPLVGLAIAVAWAVPPQVVVRVPALGTAGAVAGALALAACTLATRAEAAYWTRSETLYERAIALDADNYTAHYELARHLNHRQRYAKAEVHAREAIRLIPRWADAQLNLGAALMGQERHDDAVRAFRHALSRRPDSMESRLLLASALIRAERLPDARNELARAVRSDPGQLGARLSLGTVEQQLGNLEAALDQYDWIWRAAPATAEAAMAAGHLALLVDGWAEAPARWVARGRAAAGALAPAQPDPFERIARRLASRASRSEEQP